VTVEVPTKLSSQERDLLRKLAELRGENVTTDEGLVAKIKSAFS
jgi:DnaJ-class molecular chaperone